AIGNIPKKLSNSQFNEEKGGFSKRLFRQQGTKQPINALFFGQELGSTANALFLFPHGKRASNSRIGPRLHALWTENFVYKEKFCLSSKRRVTRSLKKEASVIGSNPNKGFFLFERMNINQPNIMNILRALSPHLPIYKPQLTTTNPISHRISGAFLATIVLFFYLLCLKIGLICFTYENFYQFFFFSSKLILISVEITALALSYHLYNGVRHLLTDFSGFLFLRIGRKRSNAMDTMTDHHR
ncbi:hypothetical protein P3X46_009795, partial [Hevea brasiliensis]